MPLLAAAAPAILSALGQSFSIGAQQNMNKKTREFAVEMYNRQRTDSLSDWAMQNEYNSPTKQMQRLQEAGLNPHLVYGNGSVVANSQAMPRSSSAPSWSPQAPQFRPEESLMAFTDAKLKSAQYDNLTMQQSIMAQEALGKALDNEKKAFDKGMREQLRQLTVDMAYKAKEAAIGRIALMQSQENLNVDRNQRENEIHEKYTIPVIKSRLQQAAEQVLMTQTNRAATQEQIKKIQQEISNLEKSGKIKDFEIQLNKLGFTKSDPVWYRMGSKILENLGISL